jgi:hypothetical protein
VREWRYNFIIYDLSTTLRWVVRFTDRPLYPKGKEPPYPLDRRLGGHQSRSGPCGVQKNHLSLPGIEHRHVQFVDRRCTDWVIPALEVFKKTSYQFHAPSAFPLEKRPSIQRQGNTSCKSLIFSPNKEYNFVFCANKPIDDMLNSLRCDVHTMVSVSSSYTLRSDAMHSGRRLRCFERMDCLHLQGWVLNSGSKQASNKWLFACSAYSVPEDGSSTFLQKSVNSYHTITSTKIIPFVDWFGCPQTILSCKLCGGKFPMLLQGVGLFWIIIIHFNSLSCKGRQIFLFPNFKKVWEKKSVEHFDASFTPLPHFNINIKSICDYFLILYKYSWLQHLYRTPSERAPKQLLYYQQKVRLHYELRRLLRVSSGT